MTTKVLLVGDTHILNWDSAHPELQRAVRQADIALHAGDWVGLDAVEGFQKQAKQSFVVHGNSDPVAIREMLPYREIIEIEQVRIGLIHPAWGREEFGPEKLIPDFPFDDCGKLDIICFGHLHETMDVDAEGMRFINAGQGYPSFHVPGTIGWLYISKSEITVEIEEFAQAT